jgi:NTP pyrophosphatase (non-canonical NTP hydrolase)
MGLSMGLKVVDADARMKNWRWNMEIKKIQKDVHNLAIEKGWHVNGADVPAWISNIHAEASEAFEDYRDGVMKTWIRDDGKPCGFPSEMADIVIRVMDVCEALGINLELEIAVKHEFNKTRAYRHGNKRC